MRRRFGLALLALASCGLELVGAGTAIDVDPNGVDGGDASTQHDGATSDASFVSDDRDVRCTTADVATDLAHCGGCDMACPAGSDACIDGNCYASLRVSARVDGKSDLVIQGSTIRWYHIEYVPPGDTTLNDTKWLPSWPPGDLKECKCYSSSTSLEAPLPPREQQVKLEQHAGRTRPSLKQPTSDNDYTLRVQFDDHKGGDDFYDLTITYETR